MPLTNPAARTVRTLVTAGLPDLATDYPFLANQPMTFWSAEAANLYGLAIPGDQSAFRFTHRLAANLGAAEISIAIPSTIPATSVDSVSLDAAVDPTVLTTPGASAGIDVLRAVVIRDSGPTVLRRRGTDVANGALSADSFKVESATSIRLRGPASGSYKAGETFTIILVPQASIAALTGTLGTQLNANREYEDVAYPLLYAVCGALGEVNCKAALPG